MAVVEKRVASVIETGKAGENCLKCCNEDVSNIAKTSCSKLSHKQWRRLWKKEKRRTIRQETARKFQLLEEEERIRNGLTLSDAIVAKQKQEEWQELLQEKKRQKLHEEWLAKEKLAQEEFEKKKNDAERRKQERIEQEKRIKEEWENQQKYEKLASERKEKAVRERETKLAKVLEKSGIINSSKDEGEWHNPIAEGIPENPKLYGTEQDPNNCSFYLKTGACRFGERCSRQHPRPDSGVTLLIPNMFQDVRLTEVMLDEKDQDVGLEFDEDELYQNFKEFYHDVLGEFKVFGEIYQFKVCSNFEPHLRGNVYVQFRREEDALAAFAKFNGRWYAGRQLSVQFSPVTKWKSAICGTFARNRCPRGKNCNFLHVFRNPNNAFSDADRDFDSMRNRPPSSHRSEREWRSSTRELERRWERADSNYYDRSRREKSHHSERKRRSRSHDRYRERSKSPKRHTVRSNSRERSTSKLKSKRHRQRSRSRERRSKSRERRSRSRERRSRSRDRKSLSRKEKSRYAAVSKRRDRSKSLSPSLEPKKRGKTRRKRSSSMSSSLSDSSDESVHNYNSKKNAVGKRRQSSKSFRKDRNFRNSYAEDNFEVEVEDDSD